jgi:FkbM family methyltransferase
MIVPNSSSLDPQRDAAGTSLSGVRSRLAHEVPRLCVTADLPLVADVGDAAALRRIAEAQSSDLVRMRRALGAANRLAAQRLDLLRRVAPPTGQTKLVDEPTTVDALRRTILSVQEDIRALIELSRWRRLGQALRLAKKLPWEAGGWQSRLVMTVDASRSEEEGAPAPGVAELRVELGRLLTLREELGRSRWRLLGQRLGVAKRLDWELGPPVALPDESTDAPLAAPAKDRAPTQSMAAPSVVRHAPSTYEGFIEHTSRRFLEECRGFAVDVILDVGANIGQYAKGLRQQGYHGQIVSFEPLSDAHAKLSAAAEADPLWDVVERCALGAEEGSAKINIAGNSASSSLLPMLDRHRDAAPHSAYLGSEDCPVTTLDAVIDRTFSDASCIFGLKMDTQGYEAQVLAGLVRHLDKIRVIQCEMSLAPLYGGGPTIQELCKLLAQLGFRCVALGPEFEDPATGELLQVDGVFVKRD